MGDSPIPRPASGQHIMTKLEELQRDLQALIRVVQAIKREQERLNGLVEARSNGERTV